MSQIKTLGFATLIFIFHSVSFAQETCNDALKQAQVSCSDTGKSSLQLLKQCTEARNNCMTVCKKDADGAGDEVLQDVYLDSLKACKSGEVAKKHKLMSSQSSRT